MSNELATFDRQQMVNILQDEHLVVHEILVSETNPDFAVEIIHTLSIKDPKAFLDKAYRGTEEWTFTGPGLAVYDATNRFYNKNDI